MEKLSHDSGEEPSGIKDFEKDMLSESVDYDSYRYELAQTLKNLRSKGEVGRELAKDILEQERKIDRYIVARELISKDRESNARIEKICRHVEDIIGKTNGSVVGINKWYHKWNYTQRYPDPIFTSSKEEFAREFLSLDRIESYREEVKEYKREKLEWESGRSEYKPTDPDDTWSHEISVPISDFELCEMLVQSSGVSDYDVDVFIGNRKILGSEDTFSPEASQSPDITKYFYIDSEGDSVDISMEEYFKVLSYAEDLSEARRVKLIQDSNSCYSDRYSDRWGKTARVDNSNLLDYLEDQIIKTREKFGDFRELNDSLEIVQQEKTMRDRKSDSRFDNSSAYHHYNRIFI